MVIIKNDIKNGNNNIIKKNNYKTIITMTQW